MISDPTEPRSTSLQEKQIRREQTTIDPDVDLSGQNERRTDIMEKEKEENREEIHDHDNSSLHVEDFSRGNGENGTLDSVQDIEDGGSATQAASDTEQDGEDIENGALEERRDGSSESDQNVEDFTLEERRDDEVFLYTWDAMQKNRMTTESWDHVWEIVNDLLLDSMNLVDNAEQGSVCQEFLEHFFYFFIKLAMTIYSCVGFFWNRNFLWSNFLFKSCLWPPPPIINILKSYIIYFCY
jgi:hypothetical protein